MATRTTYNPVYPEGLEQDKPFKSITAVHKFLVENKAKVKKANKLAHSDAISITCSWNEFHTENKPSSFNPMMIGYREFTLEKDESLSYSRHPQMEF